MPFGQSPRIVILARRRLATGRRWNRAAGGAGSVSNAKLRCGAKCPCPNKVSAHRTRDSVLMIHGRVAADGNYKLFCREAGDAEPSRPAAASRPQREPQFSRRWGSTSDLPAR